ncbi:MAG: hypothetical protein IJ057_13045 [Bacteroidales bacterium]|nr:hypothetical protein [Bacteroidales bacterium]
MTDTIEIGTHWEDSGIVLDDGFDLEMTVESGFDIMVEAEFDDESEVHLIVGDIVDESVAAETEYDFGMEFSNAERAYVYVGPDLPAVEVEWSTDAWFRSDGWFDSEGW